MGQSDVPVSVVFSVEKKNLYFKVNFKDPIGSTQGFMNRAASHLAERKELRGAVQNEKTFIGRGSGNKEVIWRKKSGLVIARSLSFRG